MRVKLSEFSDLMALMIVLYLYSLPLIALVVLPLFGWTIAPTKDIVHFAADLVGYLRLAYDPRNR